MADNLSVISFHNGGRTMENQSGDTPYGIARAMDLALTGVNIYVGSQQVQPDHSLHDGDIVSFQQDKVKSGSDKVLFCTMI